MGNGRTRKDSPAVKVYCLPDERAQLQANAAAAGMSVSSYMLNVTLGYGVRGVKDHRYVADLIASAEIRVACPDCSSYG